MKRHLILWSVFLYFVVGLIAGFPPYYSIRQIPFSSRLISLYSQIDFIQKWPMYTPPPKTRYFIKFSTLTEEGWSALTIPFEEIRKKAQKTFLFLPQGVMRIIVFFSPSGGLELIKSSRQEKFYYQQLSDYFCFGDGKIPGLLTIRFYIEEQAVPLFYSQDLSSGGLPSQESRITPIYERDCSDI